MVDIVEHKKLELLQAIFAAALRKFAFKLTAFLYSNVSTTHWR